VEKDRASDEALQPVGKLPQANIDAFLLNVSNNARSREAAGVVLSIVRELKEQQWNK
jgi:hypothetical protein